MTQYGASNDFELGSGISQLRGEAMHQSGVLDATVEQLAESNDGADLEPEIMGN